MENNKLYQFIKANIPNILLSDTGIEAIAAAFQERNFIKDDYLLRAGRVGGYFVLAEGCMRAYTFDANGQETTTAFYMQDRVVFDAASFFHRIPSTENIQAVTACRGYYTDFERLNGLFHAVPEFREFGRAILIKELIALKQRTLAMINLSAEQRYAQLMEHNKELLQVAQLKHIASYLGITDTSLSRIRRDFANRHIP